MRGDERRDLTRVRDHVVRFHVLETPEPDGSWGQVACPRAGERRGRGGRGRLEAAFHGEGKRARPLRTDPAEA